MEFTYDTETKRMELKSPTAAEEAEESVPNEWSSMIDMDQSAREYYDE